jgi:hypothetical protein
MEQLRNFGDERNTGFCVHCRGPAETRDHAPSKVFLDAPYPENLPVHESCTECNAGFSQDEEYLACFLECVLAGSARPQDVRRETVRRILDRSPALAARIEKSKRVENDGSGERLIWDVEVARVRNVVLKLARCHAAFELNEPQTGAPEICDFRPLALLSAEQRSAFEAVSGGSMTVWPEVGSRAMQRLLIVGDQAYQEGWIEVQEGRYRYMVAAEGGVLVRGVVREYLAFEVLWRD